MHQAASFAARKNVPKSSATLLQHQDREFSRQDAQSRIAGTLHQQSLAVNSSLSTSMDAGLRMP
jgi:hypothetical protein